MIETIKLRKVYGRTVAVEGLDLRIKKGEIFGLLGPNGAGKTTTIRMLATLLEPTGGEMRVSGFDVAREPWKVRPLIGYIPDFYGMPPGLKAWEYLDYFGSAYGIDSSKRKKKIDELLELVKLTDKAGTFISGMSRGMKQRLCVAKALLHDPEALLLDEPTSGLDPESRMDLRRILKHLQTEGRTVLISSHLLSDLSGFCNALGIMDKGKLLESGPIEKLKERYTTHRSVRINVVLGVDAIEGHLSSDRKITEYDIEGSEVTLKFTGNIMDLADLNARLNNAGIRVSEFRELDEAIENIFMKVTEGSTEGDK